MLINLRTVHHPTTLEEADTLLKNPGVYPIYGGGASLIRGEHGDVEATVDLSKLVLQSVIITADDIELCAGATLETVALSDSDLGRIINASMSLTLRNAFTVGDLLLERDPYSPVLALFYGLNAEIQTTTGSLTIDQWFDLRADQRRMTVVQSVICKSYSRYTFAYEKVARTPADAPIVGAIGMVSDSDRYAVVIGVASRPVRYVEGLQSQIDDYKGSVVYRSEMAKIISARATASAVELVKHSK
jgi:CO/xanthine dehydrogenase FAD-binding subunit